MTKGSSYQALKSIRTFILKDVLCRECSQLSLAELSVQACLGHGESSDSQLLAQGLPTSLAEASVDCTLSRTSTQPFFLFFFSWGQAYHGLKALLVGSTPLPSVFSHISTNPKQIHTCLTPYWNFTKLQSGVGRGLISVLEWRRIHSELMCMVEFISLWPIGLRASVSCCWPEDP